MVCCCFELLLTYHVFLAVPLQVCRDINRIKVCMETGQTVVLLNLENLYESLYDALNQSFVNLGGEKYVDLGLGTHRVKCRVDSKFR